ncbi:MAG TPA: hypothetical protein VNJ51_06890 [Candidatus Dormibacteraeota bacterium]|nr:hypothetical protein [Candidatus Dormibacteraeota bacterium]
MTDAPNALNLIFSMPAAAPGIVQHAVRAGAPAREGPHALAGATLDPLVGGLLIAACLAVAVGCFLLAAGAARREVGERRVTSGAWWLR